jgi:hypothetical protein
MELKAPTGGQDFWLPPMFGKLSDAAGEDRLDCRGTQQTAVKPLNLQTGKEDGHQGGRRYKPGDRGHEILKWAADVASLNEAEFLSSDCGEQGGAMFHKRFSRCQAPVDFSFSPFCRPSRLAVADQYECV